MTAQQSDATPSPSPTTFNLADLFEQAVDAWPEREYLVTWSRQRRASRRTYAEMEARANRLAHHLSAQGIGPGDHVGIYALNCVEWVEALWAVFKLRAVWININYRYVDDELAYLFDNADLRALVVAPEYVDAVERARTSLAELRHVLVLGDEYEAALAAQSPERDFGPRSGDDLYILYTGGTTGMPKGVVWRHEDVLMALGGGIDVRTHEKVTSPQDFLAKGSTGFSMSFLPIMPLMHGATQWSVMSQSFIGNKLVLIDKFDAADVWRLVESEKVNLIMISGDAMGRPLWDELQVRGGDYDISSLFAISSSAALFSSWLKDAFLDRFANLVITDAIGSSESGSTGITMVTKGAVMKGGPTVAKGRDVAVLDAELRPIPPGTGEVGMLARTGNLPLGYYKDPVKTAATFVVAADGQRYCLSGDNACVEADGSVTMLGRGSVSINSGGEKIFPEEVENAVRSHPDVVDAVVVGVPHERWGQTVAAVVQLRSGASMTLPDLASHARASIAGYKVPRRLTLVSSIQRSPAGKPDYRWAAQVAAEDPHAQVDSAEGGE